MEETRDLGKNKEINKKSVSSCLMNKLPVSLRKYRQGQRSPTGPGPAAPNVNTNLKPKSPRAKWTSGGSPVSAQRTAGSGRAGLGSISGCRVVRAPVVPGPLAALMTTCGVNVTYICTQDTSKHGNLSR